MALAYLGCGSNGSPEGVKEPIAASPVVASGEATPVVEPPGASKELLVKGEDKCTSDGDCAPASCCHPRACVAKNKAPACEGERCTLNCIGGTMDCGGRCLCLEGQCAAQLAPPLLSPKVSTQEN